MLILLLLVGVVLCSPLSSHPFSTSDQTAAGDRWHAPTKISSSPDEESELNSLPIFLFSERPNERLIYAESVLHRAVPNKFFAKKNTVTTGKDEQTEQDSNAFQSSAGMEDQPRKRVMKISHETQNMRHHLIGVIRRSDLEPRPHSRLVERHAKDTFLPSLILVQDINNEPTEVEDPGTTPTTVGMSESIVSSEEYTNKLSESMRNITKNTVHSARDNSDLKTDESGSEDSTLNPNSFDSLNRHLTEPLENSYINANTRSNFKIKTVNNTYTLVHENPETSAVLQTENEPPKKTELTTPSIALQHHQKESNRDAKVITVELSGVNNQEGETIQSKRDMTDAQVTEQTKGADNSTADNNLARLSTDENHETVGKKSDDRNKNIFNKEITLVAIKASQDSKITNSSVEIESTTLSELLTIADEGDNRSAEFISNNSKTEGNSAYTNKINSSKETREINSESVFSLMASNIEIKNVKKDNRDLPNSKSEIPNKTIYHMDVITSSSEVSYKQFDPTANNTELNKTFQTFISLNGSRVHNTTVSDQTVGVKQSQHIRTNSTCANSTIPIATGSAADPTEEETNVTSLPSQTSVVEPIRSNTSSALPHVTLPSSLRRPKEVMNSHIVSNSSASDAVSLHPLAVGSEQQLSAQRESSRVTSIQQERISVPINRSISTGTVAAIVVGVLLSMTIIGGATAYVVYQRLEGFRPKILSSDRSCANSDSGGYLDDQCRVAYVNSQIDIPKNTPEDLVSLDNDSFLNSLESMTIQNLWTDTIRHTKL